MAEEMMDEAMLEDIPPELLEGDVAGEALPLGEEIPPPGGQDVPEQGPAEGIVISLASFPEAADFQVGDTVTMEIAELDGDNVRLVVAQPEDASVLEETGEILAAEEPLGDEPVGDDLLA